VSCAGAGVSFGVGLALHASCSGECVVSSGAVGLSGASLRAREECVVCVGVTEELEKGAVMMTHKEGNLLSSLAMT